MSFRDQVVERLQSHFTVPRSTRLAPRVPFLGAFFFSWGPPFLPRISSYFKGMDKLTDDQIRDILSRTRIIALVGYSANATRASNSVARFLVAQGYRVIPVNPGLAGQTALGETVVASLADIPSDVKIDMVDIFRRSEDVPPVVEDALAHLPHLKTIWMQLGIVNEAAADQARAKGIEVVMNRCPAIEIPRLAA